MSPQPYPDYLIGLSDSRFIGVWEAWLPRFYQALEEQQHACNYSLTLEFTLKAPTTAPPHTIIPKDLLTAAKYLEYNVPSSTNYFIGYDHDYLNFHTASAYLMDYMQRRRRNDYEVGCSTAYALTAAIAPELLDYQIPNLTIISVTLR